MTIKLETSSRHNLQKQPQQQKQQKVTYLSQTVRNCSGGKSDINLVGNITTILFQHCRELFNQLSLMFHFFTP